MAPRTRSKSIAARNVSTDSTPIAHSPTVSASRRRKIPTGKTVHFGKGASIIQGPSGKDFSEKAGPTRSVHIDPCELRSAGSRFDTDQAINRDEDDNLDRTVDFDKEIQSQFDREADQFYEFASKWTDHTEASNISSNSVDGEHTADSQLCEQMFSLMEQIKELADKSRQSLERGSFSTKRDYMEMILAPSNAELVRYIGYLAIGGPDGEFAWMKLLCNETCRRALIVGIIGRALKEIVFDSLWFGSTVEQERILHRMEKEYLNRDGAPTRNELWRITADPGIVGFVRSERMAEEVSKFPHLSCDLGFTRACTKVTLQLVKLIAPLWIPFRKGNLSALQLENGLQPIVYHAGIISRTMRQAGQVIYYFPPTFKDEYFNPHRMECFNLDEMLLKSPYTKQTINGVEKAILQPEHTSRGDALVRVVCFPGVEAYRKAGDTLDQSSAPPDVQQTRAMTNNDGIRTKIICKSVVLLHWGRQRLLTKEAGTAAHIEAKQGGRVSKYDEDYEGFTEFYDMALERWTRASQ